MNNRKYIVPTCIQDVNIIVQRRPESGSIPRYEIQFVVVYTPWIHCIHILLAHWHFSTRISILDSPPCLRSKRSFGLQELSFDNALGAT